IPSAVATAPRSMSNRTHLRIRSDVIEPSRRRQPRPSAQRPEDHEAQPADDDRRRDHPEQLAVAREEPLGADHRHHPPRHAGPASYSVAPNTGWRLPTRAVRFVIGTWRLAPFQGSSCTCRDPSVTSSPSGTSTSTRAERGSGVRFFTVTASVPVPAMSSLLIAGTATFAGGGFPTTAAWVWSAWKGY